MSHDTMTRARSSTSQIWPADMQHDYRVNVGEAERLASVMGGGVLALLGLTRGGLLGAAMALGGGALVYRGVTGHCEAYHALGLDTAHSHPRGETPRTI
jgi:uncharacterized membrane protein